MNTPKKEIFGWAMYDFANSGFTTVVLTAVFASYFVAVVAGDLPSGEATFYWTLIIAIANGIVLLTAPVIGAIADFSGAKKRFLLITTIGCVIFTAGLSLVGPSDIFLAAILLILACTMFYSGENIIAAFLPEISSAKNMGRISAFGWSLGYVGGLIILGISLAYVDVAQQRGEPSTEFVPITMIIVAIGFALASLPTFFWLKERAIRQALPKGRHFFSISFHRLNHTIQHAYQYTDLFRFLVSLCIFYSGINTVIILASIYAQEAMGFETKDTILLILVVNITAAIGAAVFGYLQDKIGALHIIKFTLLIWISAMFIAYYTEDKTTFWVVANLIGLALGSSQSASRALVGLFSPPAKSAEFFGLWGLATKASAIIGPIVYGLIAHISGGNHRQALLSTCIFFILGFILLFSVDQARGQKAATENAGDESLRNKNP